MRLGVGGAMALFVSWVRRGLSEYHCFLLELLITSLLILIS